MSDLAGASIPWLDTKQMVEVDRAMIEDYRIELVQMMENAGRNLAHLARTHFLADDPRAKRVLALAGGGGNGGGGLVAARRLHNWGANVTVVLGQEAKAMTPIPGHQLDILRRMKVPGAEGPLPIEELGAADLILDGLIGYSLKGAPQGRIADLIRFANARLEPTLALDAPSGIDTTTGTVYEPAIMALATMTLALPKEGLRSEAAKRHVGELYLADISVPPELYAEPALGLNVSPLFATEDIIRIG
jgi:NAD(P)H-hydrate epimerase